jgi:hypothetical protein
LSLILFLCAFFFLFTALIVLFPLPLFINSSDLKGVVSPYYGTTLFVQIQIKFIENDCLLILWSLLLKFLAGCFLVFSNRNCFVNLAFRKKSMFIVLLDGTICLNIIRLFSQPLCKSQWKYHQQFPAQHLYDNSLCCWLWKQVFQCI